MLDYIIFVENMPYIEVKGLACCGISEIDGISYDNTTPKHVLNEIVNGWFGVSDWNREQFKFAIFSVTDNKLRYGTALVNYIKEHKLGTVKKSSGINPNTENMLHVYVWSINIQNLEKYCKKYHEDVYNDYK